MFVNGGRGGGQPPVCNQLGFFLREKDAECSETIFMCACLLHKDLCKLKLSTEENTYLGIVGEEFLFWGFKQNQNRMF